MGVAGVRMAVVVGLCLCLCLWLSLECSFTKAELQKMEHPTKEEGSLRFLVVGDWGRRGTFNQSHVASQMGKVGEEMDIDLVISTGDNFYEDGLIGEDDPAFEESFTNIYTQKGLQTQWYSVLGNHDYRGKVAAQLSPFLRKIEPRWVCLRSFILDAAELAEIFFVDTSPFVKAYVEGRDEHAYDWTGIPSPATYTANLLKEVEEALRESKARWKIVVGHHPIRSIGVHGDTQELVESLLPILKANGVDFYMNGHDHCLQHISDTNSPIQFLTSGGGSKAWRGVIKGLDTEGLNFYYDGQGFMSVSLSQTQANIVFYDVFGNVLHTLTSSKQIIYSSA